MDAYNQLTEAYLAAGVRHVVWVVPPVPLAVPETTIRVEPANYRVEQAVVRQVATSHQSSGAVLVELESWLQATGNLGRDWRPDGLHITDTNSAQLAEEYLGPLILRDVQGG